MVGISFANLSSGQRLKKAFLPLARVARPQNMACLGKAFPAGQPLAVKCQRQQRPFGSDVCQAT